MKKTILPLILFAATGSLFAQQAPATESNFELGAQFGYESHYVFRGIERADDNVQAVLSAGYVLGGSGSWGYKAYGEMFYMSPISSDDNNEIDWKLGARAVYDDEYFFDLGYVLRTYPGAEGLNRSNEIFFGIGRDLEFVQDADWSRVIVGGMVSYDWNLEQTSWEVYAEKTFEEVADPDLDVRVRANYGYITANDWDGDQDHGLSSPNNDYGYVAASVDGIYHLDNGTDLVLGVRYAYNNDNRPGIDNNEFWWGASISFRY